MRPAESRGSADEVVFQRTGDATASLDCTVDPAGKWLVVTVHHGWNGTDVYFRRANGDVQWRPLTVGGTASYRAIPNGDFILVQTDEDAPRGRVFRVDPTDPARERWREIVPERAGASLRRAALIGDRLLLTYAIDALSSFEIVDSEGGVRSIRLPGVGAASMTGRPGDDTAFLRFSSMGTPPQTWRVSVRTGARSLFSERRLPFDQDRFVTERLFATSKDGTRVPLFVSHARDVKLDGSAPAILYGYGGFRVSLQPAFVEGVVPWLERGGIYAIACLRGGLEYGESWHRAGMRHEKQHVFDDFIASAEALVQGGFTRPERLVVQGASNGGLLVAVAAIQRPDLFRAVLCGEPLADMIRFPLFGESGRAGAASCGLGGRSHGGGGSPR